MSKYDRMPCDSRRHVSYTDCDTAHERLALEARIIRGLIRGLKVTGWTPVYVYDGGEQVKVKNETETLDTVFSVDESTITFESELAGERVRHGVLIVLGNGQDCIPDYGMAQEESNWNATMDRLMDEISERYG